MKIDIYTIKFLHSSLGEVEIRRINLNDWSKLSTLARDQRLSDTDFLSECLKHQVNKIGSGDFNITSLSDIEIQELGGFLAKSDALIFENYKETGTVALDIRTAIKKFELEWNQSTKAMLEPVGKIFEEFKRTILPIKVPALEISKELQAAFAGMASVQEQFAKSYQPLFSEMQKALSGYRALGKSIQESIQPALDSWNSILKQNASLFDGWQGTWKELAEKFQLNEKKAVTILQKYDWFITPSLPPHFIHRTVKIGSKKGKKKIRIDALFIKYFSEDNWSNLESMVDDWKSSPLLGKRVKILKSVVQAMRKLPRNINGTTVVLPTVISQIDGAFHDFIPLASRTENYRRKKQAFESAFTSILGTDLDGLFTDILLNKLFQSANLGQPLAVPFNLNRHKILHGEFLEYGKKEYLIKAFLVLDFLAHLK